MLEKPFPDEVINLVKQGDHRKVLSIIRNDEALYTLVDVNGVHLLSLAAKYNNWNLIDSLSNLGCELDIKDSLGTTPLITALLNDSFKAARGLLNKYVHNLVERCYSESLSLAQASQNVVADIYSKLRNEKFSSEKIGGLLARAHACLCSVVSLNDVIITKNYLRSFKSRDMIEHKNTLFDDLMPELDMQHLKIILNDESSHKYKILVPLCGHIVHHIEKYQKTKTGRKFLKKIFSWDIFNEANLNCLERAIKQSTRKQIDLFLKYDFHASAKERYKRDLLAYLFNVNKLKFITFFRKNQMTYDVHRQSFLLRKTPLHFAIVHEARKSIKYMFDMNEIDQTLLGLSFESTDKECIEMLLVGDPTERSFDSAFCKFIYNSYSDDLRRFITSQVVIYEAIGRSVLPEIKLKCLVNPMSKIFYKECVQQMSQLEATKIKDQISMFTILVENPVKISQNLKQEDLETIFKFAKDNKKTLYLHYREELKKSAKDIAKIHFCRNNAILMISQFIGVYNTDHLAVHKIFNYLSCRDILKFEHLSM